jgi:hypothetical protein
MLLTVITAGVVRIDCCSGLLGSISFVHMYPVACIDCF